MITNFKIFESTKPIITYYPNGQKQSEEYRINDKLHREDGPALQSWYTNGQKRLETYWVDNNRHKEDGHAFQSWYESGQKDLEIYYINGEKYDREKWIEKLKEIDSPHYEEEKMKCEAEKYNI